MCSADKCGNVIGYHLARRFPRGRLDFENISGSLVKSLKCKMVSLNNDNDNVDVPSKNNSMENNEVLLEQGDGLLDAGTLTRCKNAVCFIYCNSEESIK